MPQTYYTPDTVNGARARLKLRQRRRIDTGRNPEWLACSKSPAYFIGRYVRLFNATEEAWQPFDLWPAQAEVLTTLQTERQVVVLKARQLGLTWLTCAMALWAMLFRPAATVGIFSQRETDAKDLLNFRLKGMFERLPEWARVAPGTENNSTRWSLSNGSSAMAFPTTAGRGYTFSLVIVDEADFQPGLPELLNSVQPAVDAGGKLWLISSVNKDEPLSRFKKVYRAAAAGDTSWAGVFLPWQARPDRTQAWYDQQKADSIANTGSVDALQQEYPASDLEALAPPSMDKRLPNAWLRKCYEGLKPEVPALALPGLSLYAYPVLNKRYVIGVDPAEGNPNSDDSAAVVLEAVTGEEVAALAGRFEPSVFAGYVAQLADYYNGAGLLVERNNHGHAVILWLRDNTPLRLLNGEDGKPGWQTNSLSKAKLYTTAADSFREEEVTLHGLETFSQLSSIDGSTLNAPNGMKDDLAMAFVLANVARVGRAGRKAVQARARV